MLKKAMLTAATLISPFSAHAADTPDANPPIQDVTQSQSNISSNEGVAHGGSIAVNVYAQMETFGQQVREFSQAHRTLFESNRDKEICEIETANSLIEQGNDLLTLRDNILSSLTESELAVLNQMDSLHANGGASVPQYNQIRSQHPDVEKNFLDLAQFSVRSRNVEDTLKFLDESASTIWVIRELSGCPPVAPPP